jgi:hypothetical protein
MASALRHETVSPLCKSTSLSLQDWEEKERTTVNQILTRNKVLKSATENITDQYDQA